jgi:Flp pilus assembly protein TadG
MRKDPGVEQPRRMRTGLLSRTSRARERGYVLLTMALTAVVLFAALGMAVDIGRMFIGKSEVQAFSDSASLSVAMLLDGTTNGITAAQNAVANSANTWNLDTTKVTSYQLDFAQTAVGPWVTSPNPATGYIYARVRGTVPVTLYFMGVLVPQKSQNVASLSVAGQIAQQSLGQGLGPYTAVGPDPTDKTNFGLVPGNQYDIQWPAYNGNRNGCNNGNPAKCFVSPPCSGESQTSEQEVAQQWGASINGYWGSNSNSTIDKEVLDVIQLRAVQPGGDIVMASGNKNAEAVALDIRVNEDGDVIDNTPSTYLSNTSHNGRRLLALPMVTPIQVNGVAEGYVLGYAAFLLLSNGNPSDYYTSGNGNDPFCAIYVGAYVQSGTGPGGGAAGYYKVKLVQ